MKTAIVTVTTAASLAVAASFLVNVGVSAQERQAPGFHITIPGLQQEVPKEEWQDWEREREREQERAHERERERERERHEHGDRDRDGDRR